MSGINKVILISILISIFAKYERVEAGIIPNQNPDIVFIVENDKISEDNYWSELKILFHFPVFVLQAIQRSLSHEFNETKSTGLMSKVSTPVSKDGKDKKSKAGKFSLYNQENFGGPTIESTQPHGVCGELDSNLVGRVKSIKVDSGCLVLFDATGCGGVCYTFKAKTESQSVATINPLISNSLSYQIYNGGCPRTDRILRCASH